MDAPSVQVRRASGDDIGTLVGLMREFHAESDFPLDATRAARSFRTLLDDPALGAAWLAGNARDSAGHIVLCVRHAMEHGGPSAIIDDLYVRPPYRRQGVGSQLLCALLDDAQARGCCAVEVAVGAGNAPARALYARCGLAPLTDGRVSLRRVLAEPSTATGATLVSDPVDALVLDLLEWIGADARPYAEVIDAWRTSCPRLPVWEEANSRGYLVHEHRPGRPATVRVSASGRTELERRRAGR